MHISEKNPTRVTESTFFRIVIWTVSIFFVLFFIVPIVRLLVYEPPQYLITQMFAPTIVDSIEITLLSASVAVTIVILLGFPLAYLLARYQFFGKNIIDAIVELPIMIPHSVVGIALLLVFASGEPGGLILKSVGVTFGYNMFAVVMAYIFVSGTYAIKTMEEAIKTITPRIELVARTLGASPWRVIGKILIPQTARSILTGAILSWGRSISEVGSILIVAPYILPTYREIAGVQVYNQFEITGMTGAVALSAILIIISLVIFVVFKILQGQHKLFYTPGVER